MASSTRAETTAYETPLDLTWLVSQLRESTLRASLPVLLLCGVLALGFPHGFGDPTRAEWTGLLLWGLAIVVWVTGRLHSRLAGAVLSVGALATLYVVVVWARAAPLVGLLGLLGGLTALLLHDSAGLGVSLGGSAWLMFAPPDVLDVTGTLRFGTALLLWGVFGLVWLSKRPLLTTVAWSWSSFQQSQHDLERARDLQVRLKQVLEDLRDKNDQLTRLNRLTQALRHEAEAARVAKAQFVANVSHELRTPLNMITGFAEMITSSPTVYGRPLPAGLLADLDVILRNSQHLSELIDDVLDLSQVEAGRMALTKEAVRLREMIDAAVLAVKPLFDGKGLYLRVEADADVTVHCDRTRIREVLLNLLSNAGRFTDAGGVLLRAYRDAGDVVVTVSDTGPGIAPDDAQRLFEPFRQLDASPRRRFGGTGLGLAISRSFVELHGGRMWVESELGAGSTFAFRLSLDKPTRLEAGPTRWICTDWEYEQPTRPAEPSRVVQPRVLVIDPSGMLHRLLQRYTADIELLHVAEYADAVARLESEPIESVVINASSVSQELERQAASPLPVPTLVCSMPGLPQAAAALGADDYLIKPIARADLLAAVARHIGDQGRILVVDDEPEAQRLFWRILASSERGYTVQTASSGDEALDMMRAEPPDLLLLDLVMPGMDGFRLLASCEADPALGDIPVVVISARDPAGQPVITPALGVTRARGLGAQELLECLDALRQIVSGSW